jgi:hypothetical protein
MPHRPSGLKPWERRPGESPQAFEAFSAYLEMGADRSLRALGQKLNKSFTLMGDWSRNWDWVERSSAYDSHMAGERMKALRKEIKARYARFGKVSDQLMMTAIEAVKGIASNELSPQDALSFIRLSVTLADKHSEALLQEEDSGDMLEGLLAALSQNGEDIG